MAAFLLPLAKGLLSAGAKAGAKKALMNKAKSVASNKAKKFLKNKKSNKKTRSTSSEKSTTSKGGALVKAMNGGGVTAMRKSPSVKVKNPNLSAKGSKIGFQKINIQLDNINKLTGSIDDALKGQYQKEVQERKNKKEAAAKLRRSRREQLLEGGKKAAGVVSGVVSGVGGAFDFMGFITNILLGGLLLFLVKNFKKIISAFNFVRDNLYLVFASLRAMLQAFRLAGSGLKTFVKGAIKAPLKIIKAGFKGFFRLFSSILRKGGSLIGAGLRGLGNALFDFGAAAIKRIKDLAVVAGRGLVRGAKAAKDLANFLRKTAPLRKLRSVGGKLFQKALATPAARLASKISYTRLGNKAAEMAFDTRLGIRSAKKAIAPVLSTSKDFLKSGAAGGRKLITEGGELLGRGATKGREIAGAVKGKVSPFLKKILGSKGAQEVAGAAPFLKRLKGPLSKIKIPIIGPLLVLGINLLDPDVGVEESIFKALGTAVGEIVGTLIPVPILGTMIGGLLGEYGGSLLYTLFRGGGIDAVGKRIQKDFAGALDVGGKAVNYIKEGFDVAFISAEMADADVVHRLGANMLNVPLSKYEQFARDPQKVKKKLASLSGQLIPPGNLYVKEFPTSQATVNDVESYLTTLEDSQGIKLKVVIVDYINILQNQRNPNSENTYMKIKQIAEDLRAMAQRNEWIIITATQINRSGYDSSEINMGNIAESAGLGHTVDFMYGIIQDSSMHLANEYWLKILKVRKGSGKNTKNRYEINYDYMRLTETDEMVHSLT